MQIKSFQKFTLWGLFDFSQIPEKLGQFGNILKVFLVFSLFLRSQFGSGNKPTSKTNKNHNRFQF
jgi:hypothetical protein